MGGQPWLPIPGANGTEPAGLRRRLVAATIDWVILWLAIGLVDLVGLRSLIGWLPPALVAAYFVTLTASRGQTFGKMLAGIRVVDGADRAASLVRVVIREIIGKPLVAVALLGVILFSLLVDRANLRRRTSGLVGGRRARGWHDRLAGTRVMRSPH